MAHLKPVPDPKPGPRKRRAQALDRRARALRDRAPDPLRADARGRQVRPPRLLAVGGRHRRRPLLPGAAPRPRPNPTGRSATASCSPRATRRRSSTRRSPSTATSRTEDLMGLRQIGSHLQGHPDMTRTPGVEVSTGSLGQGLSMSRRHLPRAAARRPRRDRAGLHRCCPTATARRARPGRARCPRPTSSVPNLTAIVDYNHLQTDGTTEEVMDTGDVRAKFESFGWDSVEIDGHDMTAIVEALERSRTPRPPGRDRLPDQEGPRRLLHGGPLRLPRQAAEPGAGRGGAGGAGGDARARRPRRSTERGVELMPRRGEDRADRDPPGLRRRARRPRRGPRGRRRARRRPRRLHPVDEVRQAVPRALLQRRRRRGEHDVDLLRARRHRQGPLRLDLRDLRHLALLRPGAARDRPQRAQGPDRRLATAASRSARTAPRTR